MSREYVNVRLDKHIWDGLGHLIVGLERLPQYDGMKLSKTQVVNMALTRGLAQLEDEARAPAPKKAAVSKRR